jgi:hypothetical protein
MNAARFLISLSQLSGVSSVAPVAAAVNRKRAMYGCIVVVVVECLCVPVCLIEMLLSRKRRSAAVRAVLSVGRAGSEVIIAKMLPINDDFCYTFE